LDNIDGDETLRDYGDLLTAPAKIFRDKKAVAAMRQQRAQAQAAANQNANAGLEARAAVEGAKTMSDTDVGGGNNMLQAVLGGGL